MDQLSLFVYSVAWKMLSQTLPSRTPRKEDITEKKRWIDKIIPKSNMVKKKQNVQIEWLT